MSRRASLLAGGVVEDLDDDAQEELEEEERERERRLKDGDEEEDDDQDEDLDDVDVPQPRVVTSRREASADVAELAQVQAIIAAAAARFDVDAADIVARIDRTTTSAVRRARLIAMAACAVAGLAKSAGSSFGVGGNACWPARATVLASEGGRDEVSALLAAARGDELPAPAPVTAPRAKRAVKASAPSAPTPPPLAHTTPAPASVATAPARPPMLVAFDAVASALADLTDDERRRVLRAVLELYVIELYPAVP